jgi:protein-S-isoprenylcysteine O-methyltransferase Ste14
MAAVEALSSSDVTKVGIIVIVALVVIGALLSIVISAIVGRIIVLVVVVALAVLVWQQRTHIKDQMNAHKCDLNATFFGIHLDAPDSVKTACRDHA